MGVNFVYFWLNYNLEEVSCVFTSNVTPERVWSNINPPTFTSNVPPEHVWSSYINPPTTFTPNVPPERVWSYINPPAFTSNVPPELVLSYYINPSTFTSNVPPEDIWLPNKPSFSSSNRQLDFTRLTEGTGLYELHDNSSSGAAKADDDNSALASFGGNWVNISDAVIVNKPPGNHNTQPDFTHLTEGTGLHELHDDNSSSGAAKADDDNSALASFGGSWVNISDAGIVNKSTDDGGLNKPFDDGNKPTDTLAAWNTSQEKETGARVGAGGYHTCEELIDHGYRARGSCGNACYTCGEADHFDRKCTLGADCGHPSGGNSTTSYMV